MGAANALGNVAAGIHQAYEAEQSRQFADEMDRRRQMSELFGKLAADDTARPETRQAAIQMGLELYQTPHNKSYKPDMNRLIAPRTPATTNSTFTPGAAPGTVQPPIPQPTPPPVSAIGGMPTPPGITGASPTPPPDLVPPQGTSSVSQVTPGQEPGVFKTPDVIAAEKAHAVGTQTSSQIQAQIDARMKVFTDIHESLLKQGVDPLTAAREANIQAAVALGHPLPYGAMKPSTGRQTKIFDPQDPSKTMNVTPIFNPMDQSMQYVSDRGPIENPTFVPPGWTAPKTTESKTTTPGGLTTSKSSTVRSETPAPTPPPGSMSTQQAPKGKGVGHAVGNGGIAQQPPAVQAAYDQIGMYGLPTGKMSDAQSLAVNWAKKNGIDLPAMATTAGRGRADAARAMQPLLQEAQDTITNNPDVITKLGPFMGRIMKGETRLGNVPPEVRQLAGTLQSIYSFAVTMHGWRSSEAPKEFAKVYGGLEATPESLAGGLTAMQHTANAVVKVGYPGMSLTPPPANEPHPGTHVFDSKAWAAANPTGDVNAAIAAAKAQNYEVK